MPRTRQLKHGFFLNEDLAAMKPLTRLLFAGLWLLADREGRLEDRPSKIKAQIFPYHKADVDGMLSELVQGGFVQRYEADGARLMQIPRFSEHQHVHPDEKQSTFPKPSEIPGNPRTTPEIMPSSLLSSSFSSSPSLSRTNGRAKPAPAPIGADFQAFWEAYPRKRAKQSAVKAWRKINPEPELVNKIGAAVKAAAASEEWADPKYIPYPATWLNAGRWDDVLTPRASMRTAPTQLCPDCKKEPLPRNEIYCAACRSARVQ